MTGRRASGSHDGVGPDAGRGRAATTRRRRRRGPAGRGSCPGTSAALTAAQGRARRSVSAQAIHGAARYAFALRRRCAGRARSVPARDFRVPQVLPASARCAVRCLPLLALLREGVSIAFIASPHAVDVDAVWSGRGARDAALQAVACRTRRLRRQCDAEQARGHCGQRAERKRRMLRCAGLAGRSIVADRHASSPRHISGH